MDLGNRLRETRKSRGLSQRELARLSGVTFSTISLIERDQVSPSVASLRKILTAMDISLASFFEPDAADEPQIFYAANELPDLGSDGVVLKLVGSDHAQRNLSVLHETYPPGADTGEEMLSHDGEEGGVVISGNIEIQVDQECQTLGPGDAYYFHSTRPHRFRNNGKKPCVIVSANNPPTL